MISGLYGNLSLLHNKIVSTVYILLNAAFLMVRALCPTSLRVYTPFC